MKVVIMGLQGTGKTYFAKNKVLAKEPYHIVFDPNDEYAEFRRYVPHKRGLMDYDLLSQEVALFVKRFVIPNKWSLEEAESSGKEKEKRLKLVVFDEADLIMPARKNFNFALRNLWVNCRHYRLDLVAITRRPTDLNTYVMDTADYLVVYNISGHNALRVIRDISVGADIDVRELDFKKHEFLVFDRGRERTKYTFDQFNGFENVSGIQKTA